MALDISKIKTIQEAKDAQYGGGAIKDVDKVIFDKPELKKADGSIDETLLQATAKLLDEVKFADKALTKDAALLKSLEDAKTKNDNAYKFVNSVANQVDNGISRLKGLKESTDKYEGKDKKEWEAEKIKKQAELLNDQKSLKQKNEELEKKLEPLADVLGELRTAEREFEDMKTVLNDIRTGASKKKIEDHLKLAWAKNDAHNKAYVGGNVDVTFEAGVEVETGYKFFRNDTAINNIGGEFAKIFSEIDEKELFKAVEANASFFTGYAAEKKEIKLAWARVKKAFSNVKWVERKGKLSTGEVGGNYRMLSYELASSKASEEQWRDIFFLKKTEGGEENFSNEQEAFNCWARGLRWGDIFLIIGELFPKDTLNTNPLLDKSKNYLKGINGSSLVDKEYEIKFTVSSKAVTAGNVSEKDEYTKTQKVLIKKGKLGKQNDPKDNLFDFFWKVFGNSPAHVLKKKEKDTDNINKNLLQFEIDDSLISERDNFRTFQSYLIYEEFKKLFGGDVKRSDGSGVKIEWTPEIRKIISGYLQKDIRRLTSADELKKLIEVPVIKALMKDNAVDSLYIEPVSDPLAVRTVSSSMALPPSSGQYEDLNKLEVLALSKKLRKQVLYDSMMKGGDVAKLANEVVGLELRIKETKTEIRKIENAIKYFDTSDLNALKTRFNTIYDGGTQGGTVKAKYSDEQISEMKALLWAINKVGIGGLDNTFKTYSNDLDVYVIKPAQDKEGIISKLLNSKELTFEGRVEDGLKPYKNVPDGVENELTLIKAALVDLEKIRKLSDREKEEKEQITYYLDNKKYKDPAPPQTQLTFSELKTALKITDASAKEADYHLDDWKALNVHKNETKIKALIDSICETDGKVKGAFLTHLAAHNSWGITAIPAGTDQWEKFIKNNPKHIIGAIKLFTEYEQNIPNRVIIEGRIEAANKNPKADTTKPWNKSDKVDLSHFLYREAEGYTGDRLIKALAQAPQPQKNPPTEAGKKWYEHWGYAPIWAPILLIVGVGVVAYIYWENIANWWNGPAEEEGGGEKVDEEEG